MKTRNLIIFIILILFLVTTQSVFPFGADFHPLITREAVIKSKLTETDYLKNELGFKHGLDERFSVGFYDPSSSIREWIEKGSKWEDNWMVGRWIRAPRHLYDPIHPPGRLTDITESHAWISGPYTSALEWADSRPDELDPFSWADAKKYYYLALSSKYKTHIPFDEAKENNQEYYFAMTFRALGQVIHLLEDMASPAHTRNDNHGEIRPFAKYGTDMYEHYWTVDKPFPSSTYPVVNLPKFSDYWDTNVAAADFGKGLAEFTNHNFLSRDTNFDAIESYHKYIYPERTRDWWNGEEETVIYIKDDPDNPITETVKVDYMESTVKDNYLGPDYISTNNRLTARSFWDFEMEKMFGYKVFSLNDSCQMAYGIYLIPRAVGYSAGLINYFFRGKLGVQVTMPDDNTYELKVKNESAEKMENGILELYYDAVEEEAEGKLKFIRLPVKDSSGQPIVIAPVTIDAGQELANPITFPRQNYPIAKCILVFHGGQVGGTTYPGKLGEEEGAVVGKIFPVPLLKVGWAEVNFYYIFSPTGDEIISYDRTNKRYRIINVTTQEIMQVAPNDEVPGSYSPFPYYYYPVWSPDGSKFVSYAGHPDWPRLRDIYTINKDGSGLVWLDASKYSDYKSPDPLAFDIFKLFDEPVQPPGTDNFGYWGRTQAFEPNWCPDGRIVFTFCTEFFISWKENIPPTFSTAGQGTIIYGIASMNADGSDKKIVTISPEEKYTWDGTWQLVDGYTNRYYSPSCSPDNEGICFIVGTYNASEKKFYYDLYTTEKQLTTLSLTWHKVYPAWSPDGNKISFGWGDRYIINADGSNLINMTPNSWNMHWHPWSPDMTKLVFYDYEDGRINTMDSDGTNKKPIWPVTLLYQPAWSPDGLKIGCIGWSAPDYYLYVIYFDNK